MGAPAEVSPNCLGLVRRHEHATAPEPLPGHLAYRLHVSERLLGQHDGSMLEALKKLNGGVLNLPARAKDYPDRDRLALRFEQFKAAA